MDMKRIVIIFFLLIAFVPVALKGQDNAEFTNEQLTLRNELFNFLKEEGFMPDFDSDGNIGFKSEGQRYNFYISKIDENPMYVVLSKSYNNPDDYSVETIVMATKELNLYKGVKVICLDDSFSVRAELYVREAEPVKAVFYKLMEMIDSVVSDFLDECSNVASISSSISEYPFIVTQMDVANVDYDGNIIHDYGSTIYDYKTKYLKPRIVIKPLRKSGSYTVYVKLYKDNVLHRNTSTSPEDYTYSQSITLDGSSNQTVYLSGWGSNNSGQWSEGTYRYEVWYNGYCIGSKKFKVY